MSLARRPTIAPPTALRRNRTLDDALVEARETYVVRRPKSKVQHEAARTVMPGGNTRTVLFYEPFPICAARGEGAYLTDIDGHRYLNLLGEYTAGLYGHSHPVIRAAIDAALENGINYGAHNRMEAELAAIVCARFPAIELVRFTNSGTEANLMALATARHATGRSKVMVFKGGYHGGLLYFGGGGIPINAPYPFVLARYNDIDGTRAMIQREAADLAAILVEPMMGAAGCIPAEREFLSMLREEATSAGTVLIFDEVMTSRFSSGGAQRLDGITPAMTTLGKYIGGGMSFGAFGGRRDLMQMYDPTAAGSMPHAGTFNNNVLSMAAGVAGMSKVFTPDAAGALHARGEALRARLNAVFKGAGVALQMTGRSSLMGLHAVKGPIRSVDDLAGSNEAAKELVFLDLLERGHYIARRGFLALSLMVSDADLDGFVEAVKDVVTERGDVLAQG
jgi:glutamate-1-semialdehyde 2,1-aminomutase